MIIVDVQALIPLEEMDKKTVENWVIEAVQELGYKDVEMSVLLVSDEYIRDLNNRYLNRDMPTNVISFSQQEGMGPADNNHLGDVVVSVDRARAEAVEAGMDLHDRLLELLVHGICHLAGFEHEGVDSKQSKEMARVEKRLIQKIRRY